MTERALAKLEVIKTGYAQKKGGRFITFLINDGPDDDYQQLIDADLGTVLQIYVTEKDIGA